ncbi:MAG: TOPRIM nucleotidyl transferase/hydrolase domain-containing protein [Candidatus Limnocylindrales bacterium]
MVAIRRISISNFRGFEDIAIPIGHNACLVGEPGAGRSDLIEAIVRVLDPEYLRTRRGEELDFYQEDTSREVIVELVLGDLSEAERRALVSYWEWWDREGEQLITSAPDAVALGAAGHEPVVRVAYRLALRPDGAFEESIYWPKNSDPEEELYELVKRDQRQLLPFFWQRGLSARPLDLGRGELRDLVEGQQGEAFGDAVDRFLDEVEDASAKFSGQERVASALELVLRPLRSVRRFDPNRPASDLVRFLPEGGAPSGLLRSLTSAITLQGGPDHLPAIRHGSTLLAALRAGVLFAASSGRPGTIVAVDDFGGELDSYLAGHVAGQLRQSAGQLIMATRSPGAIEAFGPEEVVRFYREGSRRKAARGIRTRTKSDRIAAHHYRSKFIGALSASAVILVDGPHDHLGLGTLAERAHQLGLCPSLTGSGIALIEAGGIGEFPKLGNAARQLGIYAVALLDNDQPASAEPSAAVNNTVASVDVALWLPPRTALERLLLDGVPDVEIVRALQVLLDGMNDLSFPPDWQTRTGPSLRQLAIDVLHQRSGSLHGAFVEALDDSALSPGAIAVINRLHQLATERAEQGLVRHQ